MNIMTDLLTRCDDILSRIDALQQQLAQIATDAPIALQETIERLRYHHCTAILDDGRQIDSGACTSVINAWPALQDRLAAEFDCSPDDVTCEQDDEGQVVLVCGERVGRV